MLRQKSRHDQHNQIIEILGSQSLDLLRYIFLELEIGSYNYKCSSGHPESPEAGYEQARNKETERKKPFESK